MLSPCFSLSLSPVFILPPPCLLSNPLLLLGGLGGLGLHLVFLLLREVEDCFVTMTVEERKGNAGQFPVGMRVLAVDDDPLCLKLLEALLRRCQYNGLYQNLDLSSLFLLLPLTYCSLVCVVCPHLVFRFLLTKHHYVTFSLCSSPVLG